MTPVKLNIGCGLDYRKGFINIDGSAALPRIDQVIDFTTTKLTSTYLQESVDYILCNDFLEHHFHWEAVDLLHQFFCVLKFGGKAEIRVPDCEYILKAVNEPVEKRLRWLYGGQDIQQSKMDFSRIEYPQFFCHKYGWTRDRLTKDLVLVGFNNLRFEQLNSNVVVHADKTCI